MLERKSFYLVAVALVLGGIHLWAGDNASFVDLGFSPDGTIYMFGQYGVESAALRPWADLGVVDVPRNNYVPDGRVSYTHNEPVVAGQDGSGALYWLLTRNTALANRYGISFLHQGQPLYISLDTPGGSGNGGELIDFRDFEKSLSYRAALVPTYDGYGSNLKSSFVINLERTSRDGTKRNYVVGSPQIKRPLITGYRILKVMVAPRDGSLIFVIEMKRPGNGGFDIRYMVEAIKL